MRPTTTDIQPNEVKPSEVIKFNLNKDNLSFTFAGKVEPGDLIIDSLTNPIKLVVIYKTANSITVKKVKGNLAKYGGVERRIFKLLHHKTVYKVSC